ncbi:PREDICTED: tyrosine decarboxylase 1-like [Branchiostoma belcheri]|uniref:Tyrosine decarboxylase 1-like n=1 Tax=Branchiostoma belcheri TaxID=7741 RepID=A0A6P4YQC9_BRABE|nr:PREDICTED: tyrosine decarboxylase 1-like [Branchiostoma belcheri]
MANTADLVSAITTLAAQASLLDPGPDQRQQWTAECSSCTEEYLQKLSTPAEKAYLQPEPGQALTPQDGFIQEDPTDIDHLLREFSSSIGDAGLRAGHGGHVGYIGTGGLFPSALGDFLAAAFNPYSAIESTSPGGVHMSNMLLKWMATLFGYPEGHAGNLTSGGTAATLIAMATARDARKLHSKDFHRAVVYVTKLTHHCYAKALNVIGMYHCIRREVPMDNSYRMDPSRLDELINEDTKNDLIPFMIIGTIGSTDVGSVDPVDALTSVAERHGTWLHVDAAYGGFFSLCESTRHYFSGVERSDSIVVDPHKGLFLPYGTGVVLVREGRLLLQSNTAHSPGVCVQDATQHCTSVSPFQLSFELTTHFRAPRLWLPLKLFGLKPFRSALEEKLLLAKYFYHKVKEIPGMTTLKPPDLSVVVFHYHDTSLGGSADDFNRRLLDAILKDGRIFLSSTTVEGVFCLRICVLTFRTHLRHIDLCLSVIKECIDKLKL